MDSKSDNEGTDDEEREVELDWIIFRDHLQATQCVPGVEASKLSSGLHLLQHALCKLYGDKPNLSALVADEGKHETRTAFSQALADAGKEFKWAPSTLRKEIGICKKILRLTHLSQNFIDRIGVFQPSDKGNRLLPKKYRKVDLPLLDSWIQKLRESTRCKSPATLKNMMNFFVTMCERDLAIDLTKWPQDTTPIIERLKDRTIVAAICGKTNAAAKKARWIQTFITQIMGSDYRIPSDVLTDITNEHKEEENDGTDHHRIHSEDLDKLYRQAQESPLSTELIYLILTTTGMRIGGVSRIKIKHVARTTGDGKLKVLSSGRTIEKGNKLFVFPICPRLSELLTRWLNEARPSDPSPYVFPGTVDGHIATGTIRAAFSRLCKRAGLKGAEFHPHALRHSFAHILLEAGNPPEVVSKLLNHSSSVTTEKFYLKESAEEVASRATIPWLSGQKRKEREPLPEFLDQTRTTNKKKQKQEERIDVLKDASSAIRDFRRAFESASGKKQT